MPAPKFEYKPEGCYSYDAVCRCAEADKYQYLKEELEKIINERWGGDDVRDYIKELLAEVKKDEV